MPHDEKDLERFVTAQAPIYETALQELRAGRKRSHGMWFIFPQLRGLGHFPAAHVYGLGGLAEARAYLEHRVLGPRLTACTCATLAWTDRDLSTIFGFPDDLKFGSCMTLFEAAGGPPRTFGQALDQFCGGRQDFRTLQRLAAADG
jgi:uncharacterized protein (DUF1810 family)